MQINFDPWQIEVLEYVGNKILCTGRQVGKSTICAKDAGDYALNNRKKIILIIAPTERQAYALFSKTLEYIMETQKGMIKKGKDRPTKTQIRLINGSIIYCLPTGSTGLGIRFLTINRLYVDEAARIPEDVWSAVTPMLLTTGGDMILLSTPFGRKGFFFNAWNDKENFKKFFINSETAIKERKISSTWTEIQRDKALQYIDMERKRMSRLQFQQEYCGEFVEDLMQFFPDELIKSRMILKRHEGIKPDRHYYLGVDVGGRGGDESTFEVLERINKRLVQRENIVESYEMTTWTERMILHLDNKFDFNRIYIDSSGLGAGVFDHLLETDQTKRKVVSIENAQRSLDREEKRHKKLFKEDLYNNLLCLMERGEIDLLDDPEIFQSFKSVQFEITDSKEIRIYGNYTHIVEGIIRAAWCIKDKNLNIWVY